ncbi:MAG: hypothetical protein ACPGFA_02895 [Pikeienuella sp.]
MFPLVATVIGFAFGWFRAARRGGVTADKVQYAFGHAMAFGLAAFALAALLFQLGLLSPSAEG